MAEPTVPPDRDRLVAGVRDRLRRYIAGDDEAVLGPQALIDVGALLAGVDRITDDLPAARYAGQLLWVRSLSLPEDQDHIALIPALALLAPVWQQKPDDVPKPIAEFFATVGPDTTKPADAWHGPALALADLVRRTRDAATATVVVELLRKAVAATAPDDPERGECLANLAVALQTRFELTGAPADLAESIGLGRRALAAFPPGDVRRTAPMATLAVALRRRFGLTGAPADIDEAVDLGRQALAATPADRPERADRLTNTGVALQYRFGWSGHPEDIAAAVAMQQQAVTQTEHGHPRRGSRLVNLATALLTRFEATGAMADLESAIEACRAADADDARVRAALGATLCGALRLRFRYTGRSADLDEAVGHGEWAVAAVPPGHPDRAGVLTDLALARHARFHRQTSTGDLDQAVAELREAVDSTPHGHPDLPGRLSNLCDALLTRAESTGSRSDLDAAVEAGRRAAASDGPAIHRSNLGNALLTRYELTHDRAALDQAVEAGREAVEACPPGTRHRAACLTNLAVALHTRFSVTGRTTDLGQAVDRNREAAHEATGRVDIRVRGAARWGHWSAEAGDWPAATAGLGQAVHLLQQVAHADLPRGDQEFELGRLGGLGSDAAACALNTSDLTAAVRLLEQGRAIVLSRALGRPGSTPDRWPDDTAIRDLAGEGPIVMINVSRIRSDALLLTRDGILVEPLPGLSPAAVRERTESFLVTVADEDASGGLSALLDWLTTTIAGPVLRRLEPFLRRPEPRLWWCPTGLLSLLPVHAAAPTDFSQVVPSVTPSLRALAHARRPAGPGPEAEIAVVAASDRPGQPSLPAAAAEAAMVAGRFRGRVTLLVGESATRTAVLAAMRGHRRIHLACHAVADLDHPSQSALLLAGSPLTAADLGNLRLADADSAFSMITLSVISSFNRSGESFVCSRICRICSIKSGCSNCLPERFTATVSGG